jgi:phosphohistidine phosphatase
MASSAARRLLLLRHAKSAWPDVADHERPLASRGRRDAPFAGRWLRAAGLVPDCVVCSTARRARETWQLAAAELDASPAASFDQRVYGAAADELLDLARETASAARRLLIVGHDPAMQQLTLTLASGRTDDADTLDRTDDADTLDRVRDKFPTAAIAVLEFTGTWQELGPAQARLINFVVPRDLRAGAAER